MLLNAELFYKIQIYRNFTVDNSEHINLIYYVIKKQCIPFSCPPQSHGYPQMTPSLLYAHGEEGQGGAVHNTELYITLSSGHSDVLIFLRTFTLV